MKVTSKTTLRDILALKKGSQVLQENGVPCLSCPMAALELNTLTIGEICRMYQLDLEKILKELN
ncbi:MAG: hypothetical protein WC107_01680 [Patescibacteria group bacterium]